MKSNNLDDSFYKLIFLWVITKQQCKKHHDSMKEKVFIAIPTKNVRLLIIKYIWHACVIFFTVQNYVFTIFACKSYKSKNKFWVMQSIFVLLHCSTLLKLHMEMLLSEYLLLVTYPYTQNNNNIILNMNLIT